MKLIELSLTTNNHKEKITMPNLEFAYHYLNFNGDHSEVLPQSLQFKIRLNLADGFGKIDSDHKEFLSMLWDWSHVRDSSDQAIEKIAEAIRKFVLFGIV